MNVRYARIDDAQPLAEIEAESYPQEIAATFEDFQSYLGNPENQDTVFVAEESGTIVGFVGYAVQEMNRLSLWDIAVRRDSRSKGIATRLLTALIDRARAKNMRSLILEVSTENLSALHLYSRFNFELKERIENYYGPSCDAHVLELTFRPTETLSPEPALKTTSFRRCPTARTGSFPNI